MNKYFVIIPVFNEEKNIKTFLNKLKKFTSNIIVVNDGSTDNSENIISKIAKIKIVSLSKNKGKGMAMKKGAEFAWKKGAKGIVFMDGDNQHNPKYLQNFFKYLENGWDIIIGIRVMKAKIPLIRRFGNRIGIFLMKLLFNMEISDLLCGYRALSKKGYKNVLWQSNDYGVETEILTLISRKKLSYKTLVVDTIYLDKYKGFSLVDGFKILLRFPYWRLRKL